MSTTEEMAFRAEVADWMARHLTGRFEVLRHRGGPGDETAHSGLRREWEQVMASGAGSAWAGPAPTVAASCRCRCRWPFTRSTPAPAAPAGWATSARR